MPVTKAQGPPADALSGVARSASRKRKQEVESTSPVSKRDTKKGKTSKSGNLPNRSKVRQDSFSNAEEEYPSSDEELIPATVKSGKGAGQKSTKNTKKSNKSVPQLTETANATNDDNQIDGEPDKKIPQKRKTKEEKDAAAMPLAARTPGLRMYVGAHVSMAKGVENAVKNAVHIGGNAFALFLQSQRKWENPPLAAENRDAFLSLCKEHNYDTTSHVLPHGSYLVNLAQEDKFRAEQAYAFFVNDLKRCEALGIKLYNFHPGAAGQGNPLSPAITRLAEKLNRALSETKTVVAVLENMAGSGTVIGARFGDLREVIRQIKPEFQSRIGVCLDTCHSFASGYDLRSPESFKRVLQEFDDVVGMKYLKGLHLNDSKGPLDSKRDLHQNIGLGFLGLRAFHNVMNEPRFQNLPMILETPCERKDPSDPSGKKTIEDKSIWAREIKLLESLIGMDPDSEEFKTLEKELSDKGKAERAKLQHSVDEKNRKAQKKLEKGQKSLMDMMGKSAKKGTKSPVSTDEEVSE